MLAEFTNSTQLLQNAKRKQLFEKLIQQLEKDFVLANVPVDFTAGGSIKEVGIEDLKARLHEKIYFLIMERFPDYLNLLYVVDVPEKSFKEIRVTDVVEVAEQVSFLILKRELQKVWLREKYSA